MSRLSLESFLSHSIETLRRGTPTCSGSENFGGRKSLLIRWGEGKRVYQYLPSKNFCVTVWKKFVGESFSVSEKFRASLNLLDKKGGEKISRLSAKKFSHSAAKFRREAH